MFFDERVMTESMPSLASAIQILKNTNVEVIHLSDEEIDQLSRLFSIASNRQNQSRKGTFYDFENIFAVYLNIVSHKKSLSFVLKYCLIII